MAWRPSREGSTEVDGSNKGADSAATQVTHFRQVLKQAIGQEGELDVAHLRSILGEGVRTISAAGYPKAEAVQDLAALAILFTKWSSASPIQADHNTLAVYSELIADTSARFALVGSSTAVSDILSVLLLGLARQSEGVSRSRSRTQSLLAIGHIVHENGSTLSSTTAEAVLHRLLPHCEGPVLFPAYQNQTPASSSLPRNRGRGRSWSSGGAEQAVFEDPLEVQRLALVAFGNLFVKAGAQLTGGHCSQALEVLAKRLDSAVVPGAPARLSEDLASSRLYAALLRCLQLVLVHERTLLEPQVPSLVPSLRPFFVYGLCKRPGSASATPRGPQSWRKTSFQDPKSGSDSEGAAITRNLNQSLESLDVSGRGPVSENIVGSEERRRDERAGPGPGSTGAESGKSSYVPPHLRKGQQALLPTPSPIGASKNRGTPSKNGASFAGHLSVPLSSSDSEQSDSDGGHGDSDRYRASKVRIEALSCVQTVARRDPKALHSQWAALLPTHGALIARPQTPNLLNPLLFDPLPKVRLAAASALASMLEGPAKAFLQVAEWKDNARSGPFLSLSATLGLIVKQLHAGLLESIGTEVNSQVLAASFKALSLLISASPYHRLPNELLADTVKQVHRKTKALLANQFAAESGGVGVAALACLGSAFGTYSPVEQVAGLLKTGPLPQPPGTPLSKPATCPTFLSDLVSWCQPPNAPPIALEAFAALREALRNYGSHLVGFSPILSALLANTFGSPSVGVTDDRLVLGGVKVMDEFLRSISGGGMDDDETGTKSQNRADLRQGSKQQMRAGPGEKDSSEEGKQVGADVASATWKEVLSRHVPWLLAHPAPMVRGAALTCLAGLSRTVFETFDTQQKEFVVLSTVRASEDSIPAVRSAACRASGVVISFPFVPDRHLLTQAILKRAGDPVVSVRILAAWALANLCEALGERDTDAGPTKQVPSRTLKPLADAALEAARDGDKVRASAVRALGNLAAVADLSSEGASSSHEDTWLDRTVAALLTCTTTGNVKVQWNVCHALAHLFGNRTIDLASARWASSVYSVLLLLLRTSTNFKIRIQAAAALAVPLSRKDYGVSFPDIVRCFAGALETMDSDQGERPSDFKYRSNLQEQLTATLLHVLACADPSDFPALRDPLIKRSAFLQDFIGFAWASVITSDGQVVDSPSAVESPRTPSAQGATSSGADATWQLQKSPSHTVDFDEQPLPPPKKGSVYHGGLGIGNHGQKPVLYRLMDVQRAVESIRSVYDRNDQKEAASLYASFRVPLQST